jgi:hypothetical protein
VEDDGPEEDQHAADYPVRPAFQGFREKGEPERYKPKHGQENETVPRAPGKAEPEGHTGIRLTDDESGNGRYVIRLECVPDAGQEAARQPQEHAQIHGAFPLAVPTNSRRTITDSRCPRKKTASNSS